MQIFISSKKHNNNFWINTNHGNDHSITCAKPRC